MNRAELDVREQYVETSDGWSLHLRRTVSVLHFDATTKPLLIIPGYGMNSFIFSFHPRGTSMERCLAEGGYEVWSVDLRAQGRSKPKRGEPGEVSLRNYAAIDVRAAIEQVLSSTRTEAQQVALIGCSLGGTILFGHLALEPSPLVADVIVMGAPLRWTEVHPLLRFAFRSPRLVGAIKLSGTRR